MEIRFLDGSLRSPGSLSVKSLVSFLGEEVVSTKELFADCTKGSSEQGLSPGPRESKTAPCKCPGQGRNKRSFKAAKHTWDVRKNQPTFI